MDQKVSTQSASEVTAPAVIAAAATVDVTPSTSSDVGNTDNTAQAPPVWSKHYTTVSSHLPPFISSHLPPTDEAISTISTLSTRLTTQTTELSRNASVKLDKLRGASSVGLEGAGKKFEGFKEGLNADRFLTQAYSIENGTQIALNVSLNQVGPLFYEVLVPNTTFERRVPNAWFTISVRPYTTPSTADTAWSVTWPILALTGPVVTTVSILAIPFAALAVGGTALASLVGFGGTVASGATAAVGGVTSTSASAVAVVAKVSRLPGGNKVKGKLVEAAKNTVLGAGGEAVREKVVKYLGRGTAAATIVAGALGGTAEEVEKGREKERKELEERRKGKKFEEVEVTGYKLEDCLACKTGKKKVDNLLINAFNRLAFKAKGFKAVDNPVLRIVGGPELEERGKRQYLVFYPFLVEKVTNIEVKPLSTEELPPTSAEAQLIEDTRIVGTVEEAEEVASIAPKYGDGDWVDAKVDGEEKKTGKGKGSEKRGWFGF